MIIDMLLTAVALFVDLIVYLLPSVAIPYWDEVVGFGETLNGYLFAFDGILPLRDLAAFMRWALGVWMPAFLTFHLFRFVWKHVPVVGSG